MDNDNKPIESEEHQHLLREISYLKDTVTALRDTLDKCHDDRDGAVRDAVSESNRENQQLERIRLNQSHSLLPGNNVYMAPA